MRHDQPSPNPRHVTVELAAGPGPIHGSIDTGAGEVRSFAGWLELASALEALRPRSPGERRPA